MQTPFASWRTQVQEGARAWKQAPQALLLPTNLLGLITRNGRLPDLRIKGSLTPPHSANQSHRCHPRSWSKYAMQSHRYPEAKMLTRTAGWCAYLCPRSCYNVLILFLFVACGVIRTGETCFSLLHSPSPSSVH